MPPLKRDRPGAFRYRANGSARALPTRSCCRPRAGLRRSGRDHHEPSSSRTSPELPRAAGLRPPRSRRRAERARGSGRDAAMNLGIAGRPHRLRRQPGVGPASALALRAKAQPDDRARTRTNSSSGGARDHRPTPASGDAVAADINHREGQRRSSRGRPIRHPGRQSRRPQTPADFRTLPAPSGRAGSTSISSRPTDPRGVPGWRSGASAVVSISGNFIQFPQIGFAHSHRAPGALRCHRRMVRELIPHNVTITSSARGCSTPTRCAPTCTGTRRAAAHLRGDRRRPARGCRRTIPDRRMRRPRRLLCSAQAGFMTGQNMSMRRRYQGLF